MIRLRARAAYLGGRSGLAGLCLRGTRRLRPRWLTVLTYHRVFPFEPDSPWDIETISATPESFRRQMEYVRRYCTTITSEQLRAWKAGRQELPPNPVIITFDDGYRDNHDVALPVLQEAGLVGEFFVCPWQITERRLFWWDRIAYCVHRTRRTSIRLDYPAPMTLEIPNAAAVLPAQYALLAVVKNTRGLDVQRFLGELQVRAEVELDEPREAERLLMTWEQVRALRRAGMTVGSHSYSHPILSLTDREAARVEMVRSKREIEAALDERIDSIAYPVGRFTAETKELAAEAGYEVAYSYKTGATFTRSADFMEIRRVDVDRRVFLEYFRLLVALPFLL